MSTLLACSFIFFASWDNVKINRKEFSKIKMKAGLPHFTKKNNTMRNYSLSPDSKNLLITMSPQRHPAPTPTKLAHNKTFDNTTLSKKRDHSFKQPLKLLRRRKKGSLAADNLSVM